MSTKTFLDHMNDEFGIEHDAAICLPTTDWIKVEEVHFSENMRYAEFQHRRERWSAKMCFSRLQKRVFVGTLSTQSKTDSAFNLFYMHDHPPQKSSRHYLWSQRRIFFCIFLVPTWTYMKTRDILRRSLRKL